MSRFRYSLRTLLLTVMCVGSGTTLWFHWDPWVQERVLTGHAKPVCGIDFSVDGNRIISQGYEENVIVWDVATGKQLEVMKGQHPSAGLGVRPGPDSKPRGFKVISDVTAGWELPCAAFSECVSFDGQSRCFPINNFEIIVQHYETYTPRVILNHPARVIDAVFSPDGKRIISTSDDQNARIWDAFTGNELLVLHGNTSIVFASFSADGSRVVTTGYNNSVRVWDSTTGNTLAILNGHTESVSRARFSPDGQRIVSASGDKTARIWLRRRPDHLWGFSALPEFWLTGILVTLLFWSMLRDRKMITAAPRST